jgi:hypothetical protein
VTGPLDENGIVPHYTTLLTVDADYSAPIIIRCQVIIPANVIDDFSPRLRFYLPRDSSLCIALSGNGSHEGLGYDNECDGFNYTYYEEKDANTISFTYHVVPIARMDLSVVNCGVKRDSSPTSCFGQLAALISFQNGPTCSPPSNTTNETTKIIIEPSKTTTQPPKTTPHSMTESKTTIPQAETPIITTTVYPPPPKTDTISMEQDTFFSAVGIVVLVGIVLLSANFIQLYIIIKRRRVTATAIDLPDERGGRNDTTDRRGIELVGVLENSMAKENG